MSQQQSRHKPSQATNETVAINYGNGDFLGSMEYKIQKRNRELRQMNAKKAQNLIYN